MTEHGYPCGTLVEVPVLVRRVGLYDLVVGGIPGQWTWVVELNGAELARGEVRSRPAAERAAAAALDRLMKPRG
jgi:hypothetical protein